MTISLSTQITKSFCKKWLMTSSARWDSVCIRDGPLREQLALTSRSMHHTSLQTSTWLRDLKLPRSSSELCCWSRIRWRRFSQMKCRGVAERSILSRSREVSSQWGYTLLTLTSQISSPPKILWSIRNLKTKSSCVTRCVWRCSSSSILKKEQLGRNSTRITSSLSCERMLTQSSKSCSRSPTSSTSLVTGKKRVRASRGSLSGDQMMDLPTIWTKS